MGAAPHVAVVDDKVLSVRAQTFDDEPVAIGVCFEPPGTQCRIGGCAVYVRPRLILSMFTAAIAMLPRATTSRRLAAFTMLLRY